jgi:hypothetical protein
MLSWLLDFSFSEWSYYLLIDIILTLILLTWRIWWAPNNARKWQMLFNLAFKELILASLLLTALYFEKYSWNIIGLQKILLFAILCWFLPLNLYPTNVENLASSYQYSIILVYPKRCNVTQFIYIWKLLYIFWMVLPPIIRNAYNCIYSIWYLSHRYCYLPLSWKSWNRFECAVGGR